MEQESTLIFSKSIAIIGAGPAGCACAKFLQDFGIVDVSLFDSGEFLRTILPTGGGRCNLAHDENDFKELAKNYPRGEKFLYSIFSKFGTKDTIEMFKSIGVKTYTQENDRIFPISNSSKDVRDKILKSIHCNFIKEKVLNISPLKSGYKIETNKSSYAFDIIVIAIGGHSDFSLIKNLDINIIEPTQSLVGLITRENFSNISGVSIKNVETMGIKGDLLFTHKGVSGPLIYTISSIYARRQMPYTLSVKLSNIDNLQELLNNNPHKEIKNLISNFVPKSLAEYILCKLGINTETKCHQINGKTRDKIINCIENFEITIQDKNPDGEVVTCGGIDLNEINPKTLELKKHPNIYCCGEVMNIDGFCGGFNLQNCWSSAYVCAKSISNR